MQRRPPSRCCTTGNRRRLTAAADAAGYHQGDDPLPSPPVTKWLKSFQKQGRTDQQAFEAMLDWAHAQPVTEGARPLPGDAGGGVPVGCSVVPLAHIFV